MEQPVIVAEWQGREAEFTPKSKSWYWTVGILAGGAAIAAFIADNILFGIILILAGATTALVGSRHPAVHTFKISNRGIHIGDQVFRFENILRFAIEEDHPKKLLFELKQGFVKIMTIPIGEVDYRTVRTELKNKNIEEVEHLNSAAARLSDWMGLS